MISDKVAARHLLKLPENKKIIAILPGSRSNEVQYLGNSFLKVASWCKQQYNDLHFVTPVPNSERRKQFEKIVAEHTEQLPLTVIDGMSREVVTASDVVLLASGTAALETLLVKRPMVVAYRMSWFTYWIGKVLVKLKHYSLPNLLLPEPLIPEFIQSDIIPEKVGYTLLSYLRDDDKVSELTRRFSEVHTQLQKNASKSSANAVLELLQQKAWQ